MAKMIFLTHTAEFQEKVKAETHKMHLDIDVRLVSTKEAVAVAQQLAGDEGGVIIARGCQASLIKRYTTLPLVEVILTGQEIAVMIDQAKKLVHSQGRPVVGIIGFQNMFPNMDCFEELMDVTLRTYFVAYTEELPAAVSQAVREGVDIIIGGDTVTACAQQFGVPYVPLVSTGDSIREALRFAKLVGYAGDIERQNIIETQALLDYSFNGIVKVNIQGNILVANHVAAAILGKAKEQLIGEKLWTVVPALPKETLLEVLKNGGEVFSTYLQLKVGIIIANIAPIKMQKEVIGGIFSFHEVEKLERLETETRRELYSLHRAEGVPLDNLQVSPAMDGLIAKAKFFAASRAPVLIEGENGEEEELIARVIHNSGPQKDAPFVVANLRDYCPEDQESILFHSKAKQGREDPVNCLFSLAHNGTLYFNRISDLNEHCQHLLLRYLKDGTIYSANNRVLPINVRILAAADHHLARQVKSGRFLKDLYYQLCAFSISIPPVASRKEDIVFWADYYVKSFGNLYKKYIILSDQAKNMLLSLDWDGGMQQLKSFCEYLVFTASHRTVSEAAVLKSYQEAYCADQEKDAEPEPARQEQGNEIVLQTLKKYHGNRAMTARELGISTTTLWRRLKSVRSV